MQSQDDALSTENNLENKYQKEEDVYQERGVYKRIFGNLVYDNTVVQTLQEEEVNSSCMHASIDRVCMNIIGFGLRHTI